LSAINHLFLFIDTPCNSVLRQLNGNIVHNVGRSCKWTIELPESKRVILSVVSIKMTDDPLCYKETLQAKGKSSSILFRTCGTMKPQPVISFKNRVTVEHIVRASSLSDSSFKLQWESIDSGIDNNIFDTGII